MADSGALVWAVHWVCRGCIGFADPGVEGVRMGRVDCYLELFTHFNHPSIHPSPHVGRGPVLASPGRFRDGETRRQGDSCWQPPSMGVLGGPMGRVGPDSHRLAASVGELAHTSCASSPAGAVQHDGERHQLQQPVQPRFDTQLLPGSHDGPGQAATGACRTRSSSATPAQQQSPTSSSGEATRVRAPSAGPDGPVSLWEPRDGALPRVQTCGGQNPPDSAGLMGCRPGAHMSRPGSPSGWDTEQGGTGPPPSRPSPSRPAAAPQ